MPQVAQAVAKIPGVFVGGYTVSVASLAASATTQLTFQVQAAYHFLWRRLTGQFDQVDWTIQIHLTGLGRNIFDLPFRGALLFGEASGAAEPMWQGGFACQPPQPIPSNSNVTVTIANGSTGALNLFLGFFGTNYR